MQSRILITDFDGTITRRDFYACVAEQLLEPDDLDPWDDYTAGEITHFEALRRIFARIRADESDLERVMASMEIDPDLGDGVDGLRRAGWEVVVVSNGCRWYIDRLLDRAGVEVPVLSNPGHFDPERGLVMELPTRSPFFSPETGIDKAAVVKDHLRKGHDVAFAGDGRPDVRPALMVADDRRFAREWLADHLEEEDHPFRRFDRWSEIAGALVRSTDEVDS